MHIIKMSHQVWQGLFLIKLRHKVRLSQGLTEIKFVCIETIKISRVFLINQLEDKFPHTRLLKKIIFIHTNHSSHCEAVVLLEKK